MPDLILISTADIAADLSLDRDYVTRKVVKRPEFPAPKLRLICSQTCNANETQRQLRRKSL